MAATRGAGIWQEAARALKEPTPRQQPFALVTPMLRAALVLGAAAGFTLASILSVTLGFHLRAGLWLAAVVQAHGRIQVFGWAGLFVLGVAFHFLPRLRGAPLRWPRAVPWALSALVVGLLVRAVSQPALTFAPTAWYWRALLLLGGALETLGLGLAVALLVGTALEPGAPALRKRPALWSVWPFLLCVAASLTIEVVVNLVGVIQAADASGIVPGATDSAAVLLGLFGFLTPMALAMSARALPLYAGLESMSRGQLWPIACAYAGGLTLALLGDVVSPRVEGAGLTLMGLALMAFIVAVTRMMTRRGRLPAQVRKLAPAPEVAAKNYTRHISDERAKFGPYVALIASAYAWAFVAGALLAWVGGAQALGMLAPVPLDAARHSIAAGFIAMLIAGVSVRMIPGFSGAKIASPRLVTALLALGWAAALLRVGSLLTQPLFATGFGGGSAVNSALFGVSGPIGWLFAVCLAITLWPALPLGDGDAERHEPSPRRRASRPAGP